MDIAAVDLVYASRLWNQSSGSLKRSKKKWRRTGWNRVMILRNSSTRFSAVSFVALADKLPALAPFPVLGIISLMRRLDVVIKGYCILHKLHDAGRCAQGEHLVCADVQAALASCSMIPQELADLFEDLFHDSVLSEIVIAPI